MPATILLVEDEEPSAALIKEALSAGEFVLTHASNCAEGWRYLETLRPQLVILDVTLPDGSGLDLCRRLREHPALAPTPVIILTGKDQLKDKESGFEAGADHYLIKPFQIQELRLWVSALLRRARLDEREGGILRAANFVVDPQAHRVQAGENAIDNLTRKEFDLLYELVRQSPKVLSKDALLSTLWGTVLRDNTIEVHIKNLRAKLGLAAQRVQTLPGVGYRFV
ncbi:MAG: response regulator transcription factor [Elusimicrobia bacterium]|nr:response regulator transcription factor [Elusimicrobiota bacterium]